MLIARLFKNDGEITMITQMPNIPSLGMIELQKLRSELASLPKAIEDSEEYNMQFELEVIADRLIALYAAKTDAQIFKDFSEDKIKTSLTEQKCDIERKKKKALACKEWMNSTAYLNWLKGLDLLTTMHDIVNNTGTWLGVNLYSGCKKDMFQPGFWNGINMLNVSAITGYRSDEYPRNHIEMAIDCNQKQKSSNIRDAGMITHPSPQRLPELMPPLRSSSGCFIITATMGNVNHPKVIFLKQFRNQYLLKSIAGRIFIDLYCTVSPTIAKFIKKSTLLRKLCFVTIVIPIEKFAKYLMRN